jgi:hypothetical protein
MKLKRTPAVIITIYMFDNHTSQKKYIIRCNDNYRGSNTPVLILFPPLAFSLKNSFLVKNPDFIVDVKKINNFFFFY